MFEDISTNTKILNEKLEYIENGNLGKDHILNEEIMQIVEISDSVVKNGAVQGNVVKEYSDFKKKYRDFLYRSTEYEKIKQSGFEVRQNSCSSSDSSSIEKKSSLCTKKLCRKNTDLVALNQKRNDFAVEVERKVEEINNIQDYIHCVVKVQDERIDNLMFRMRNDEKISNEVIRDLRESLGTRKSRKRFLRYLVGFCVVIFILFVVKMFFFRVINNILL